MAIVDARAEAPQGLEGTLEAQGWDVISIPTDRIDGISILDFHTPTFPIPQGEKVSYLYIRREQVIDPQTAEPSESSVNNLYLAYDPSLKHLEIQIARRPLSETGEWEFFSLVPGDHLRNRMEIIKDMDLARFTAEERGSSIVETAHGNKIKLKSRESLPIAVPVSLQQPTAQEIAA